MTPYSRGPAGTTYCTRYIGEDEGTTGPVEENGTEGTTGDDEQPDIEGADEMTTDDQGVPLDAAEMDELMAAANTDVYEARMGTLEIEEWEEGMARNADDKEWWRDPNRIDDG